MSQTVLFCHGCNEKFAVSAGERACPQCGQTLSLLADAPTAAYADLVGRGTYFDAARDAAGSADTLVGKRLGTYSIDAFLGKGGMARVYRATHLTLERPCAIKVLNPDLVGRNAELIHAFFAEARAAASLVHPNVVTVHNIGHDDGLHFIELEYVAGNSLQRLLEAQGRLEPARATGLVLQTCSALAVAHRVGMVHRDIKPANVLVTDSDVAKLADFGLAKRVVAADRTTSGRGLLGTPYYMAPELFDGHAADPRSDVYAMGITYFCLLTGRLPFVDPSLVALARKHAEEPIPDVSQLRPDSPRGAAAVLARCLAKRAEDRYASAAALHDDLRAVFAHLRDPQQLVREALAGLDLDYQAAGDRFVIAVPLPGGRSQRVFVEFGTGGPLCEQLVKIYSVCAPLSESYYRRALELNAEIPHGSIAIQPLDGSPHFVMGNTYPRATCDPDEIRQSVLAIARYADDVERSLTASDRH